jgi:threonine dehydrogenase-like Zn-dependent dehydrogenase
MRTQVLGHYGSEAHHTEELVQFVSEGKLDLSNSVSEVLPLSQAALALEKLEKKIGNPIRIVLRP